MFERDSIVHAAAEAAGSDDFGEPTWEEGLALLLDGFEREARLNEVGRAMVESELVGYLANRAAILAWRREHPAVAAGEIRRPLFIVGQPRTGTTISTTCWRRIRLTAHPGTGRWTGPSRRPAPRLTTPTPASTRSRP